MTSEIKPTFAAIDAAPDPWLVGGEHFSKHRFAEAIPYLREAAARHGGNSTPARQLAACELYLRAEPQPPWRGTAGNELIQAAFSGHQQSHYARVYELTADRRRAGRLDGVADRTALLKYLILKNGYRSYLEIGCDRDETFAQIATERKVGVDPKRGGTLRSTSDEFFKHNSEFFDLVFIDGLHSAEQVLRDITGALSVLNSGGTIVIHDCAPRNEWEARYPKAKGCLLWTGDVWRAFVEIRTRLELDAAVGDFDWGCGVINVRPNSQPLKLDKMSSELTWEDLELNWNCFLRPKTFEELIGWLEHGE